MFRYLYRSFLFILLIIFTILSFNIYIKAENIHIYINGLDQSEQLKPVLKNGVIHVKARELAELFNAKIEWQQSIKTLSISDGDNLIKMMLDSPYIQANSRTIKSKGS